MDFSDIFTLQIHSHFRPKYTNLHQSYTNLAMIWVISILALPFAILYFLLKGIK